MLKVSSVDIVLYALPMPCSENHAYATNRRTGRRFLSKDLERFKLEMESWRLANAAMLIEAGKVLATWHVPPQLTLAIGFRHDRVWTKDGRMKRIDAANYAKVLQDSVAAALGIDDSQLWGTRVEKAPLAPGDDDQQCIARLTPTLPQTMAEWMDHLGLV